jgi:hypothetical protein
MFNSAKEDRTMTRISNGFRFACGGLLAAIVLVTAGPAAADHYPGVPRAVWKRDKSVLEGIRRMTFGDTQSITLGSDSCDCLEPTCDDGLFMIACGGEIDPIGLMTASRRTSRETCLVCGCAGEGGAELIATPVCMGF